MPDAPSANPNPGTLLACSVELADIIERVESSNIMASIRFEPHVYANHLFSAAQIKQCQGANNCNQATARVLLSMSYGLYQIMGFNLYHPGSCNFVGSIAEFLPSKIIQRKMLYAFLRSDHIGYSAADMLDKTMRDNFAAKYNGPSNVADYSAKILGACHALGVA